MLSISQWHGSFVCFCVCEFVCLIVCLLACLFVCLFAFCLFVCLCLCVCGCVCVCGVGWRCQMDGDARDVEVGEVWAKAD